MISIETLHNHTPEEVFIFVANQLINQRVPSRVLTGECMYRSENEGKTLKCAAGHLIPDHLYNYDMEGKKFDSIHTTIPLRDVKSVVISNVFEQACEYGDGLINDLQRCHDLAARDFTKKENVYLISLVRMLNNLAEERGYKKVELESQIV